MCIACQRPQPPCRIAGGSVVSESYRAGVCVAGHVHVSRARLGLAAAGFRKVGGGGGSRTTQTPSPSTSWPKCNRSSPSDPLKALGRGTQRVHGYRPAATSTCPEFVILGTGRGSQGVALGHATPLCYARSDVTLGHSLTAIIITPIRIIGAGIRVGRERVM